MTYLIVKFGLLLALAALAGFLLGRWWARRGYEDVTETHSELLRGLDAKKSELGALREQLSWLSDRSAAIEDRCESIQRAVPAQLEAMVSALPSAPETDLGPIEARLETLATAISSIDIPQATNLEPALDQITLIKQTLEAQNARVDRQAATMAELRDGFAAELEAAIGKIPEAAPTDLSGVAEQLGTLRDEVAALELRLRTASDQSNPVDLSGFEAQFAQLDTRLAELAQARQRAGSDVEAAAPLASITPDTPDTPEAESARPELFERPDAGLPDDLKRISGVGPVLEQLLHDNGVYYFRQIASWSDAEVAYIDARLAVFKGRIERDGWVAQARHLVAETA